MLPTVPWFSLPQVAIASSHASQPFPGSALPFPGQNSLPARSIIIPLPSVAIGWHCLPPRFTTTPWFSVIFRRLALPPVLLYNRLPAQLCLWQVGLASRHASHCSLVKSPPGFSPPSFHCLKLTFASLHHLLSCFTTVLEKPYIFFPSAGVI